jgi:hypothetical protein
VRTRAMSLRIYDLNRMPYQVAYELRFS